MGGELGLNKERSFADGQGGRNSLINTEYGGPKLLFLAKKDGAQRLQSSGK